MNGISNGIDYLLGLIDKVAGWMDTVFRAFVEGENKYIIYLVFLYVLGVFSMAKVNVKIDTKKK